MVNTPEPQPQPGIAKWYFTVMMHDSDPAGVRATETHGPFHSKYLAERMLTARVEQAKDEFKGPGLRSILAVPPTQPVEMALVEPVKIVDE
jgi:hypothetical protein